MSKSLKSFLFRSKFYFLLLFLCVFFISCKKNRLVSKEKKIINKQEELSLEKKDFDKKDQENEQNPDLDINYQNYNIELEEEQNILKEEERIAKEIESIESGLIDETVNYMNEIAEDIEKKLSNINTTEILDKNEDLLFMEYDDEIFLPRKTEYGWCIIHSQKENATRTKYDNEYRMLEKEKWTIKSETDSKMIEKEVFTYFDGTYIVQNKLIETDSFLKSINYNIKSQIENSQEYNLKDGNKYIINQLYRKYDDENRIISEQKLEYYYLNDFKKLNYKIEKKYDFFYNNYNNSEHIPANFNYYENGILKMQNKYFSKKGTYTSQIFFEKNYSVLTYYVDEIRSKDIYYINNEVDRIKKYD